MIVHKLLLSIVLGIFVILALPSASYAATTKTASKAKSPSLSASVAKNKRSMAVTFSNLTNVKTIKYQLTYNSNKGAQGAGGSIKVAKNTKTLSRTLLFGTCSHGVCSYHSNLKNIVLSVDFVLTTGGVVSYEKKF